MVTARTSPNDSYPNSASFFVRYNGAEGFTSVEACVNIDGYGYDVSKWAGLVAEARSTTPCFSVCY